MSLFKRTFTSLYARVDQMVGEIENHDALIQAAIKEQKKKIAIAKIQLRRVENSQQRVKEQHAQLSINAKLWTQRAANAASDNESQALLCLQRRQQIQQQMQRLTQMQNEYQQNLLRMKKEISQCEEDLSCMMQKHQVLRARQSTADAMQMIDRDHGSTVDEIENSFDRWEVKIAQGELSVDRLEDSSDPLEQEYLAEENEQQLRYELAELMKEQKMQEGDAS